MRVRIEKPCFIESDAPFTIIPIYQAKAEDPSTWGVSVIQPDTTVQPMPVEKAKRKSPKRTRRTCIWCDEGFLGRGPQMFCSNAHKQSAYRAYGNADGVRKAIGMGLVPLHAHQVKEA